MATPLDQEEAMDTSSPRGSTSADDSLVDEYNSWRKNDQNTIKLREVMFDTLPKAKWPNDLSF